MTQDNLLWQFSLVSYGKSGVEEPLLQLQDDWGLDINMLLACCWLATRHVAVTEADLRGLIEMSAQWRQECIVPLRSIRRFLKPLKEAGTLYEKVKALELDAERQQQQQLYPYLLALKATASAECSSRLMLENIQVYSCCLPGVSWMDIESRVQALIVSIEA